jgi:hypothetical protein
MVQKVSIVLDSFGDLSRQPWILMLLVGVFVFVRSVEFNSVGSNMRAQSRCFLFTAAWLQILDPILLVDLNITWLPVAKPISSAF